MLLDILSSLDLEPDRDLDRLECLLLLLLLVVVVVIAVRLDALTAAVPLVVVVALDDESLVAARSEWFEDFSRFSRLVSFELKRNMLLLKISFKFP